VLASTLDVTNFSIILSVLQVNSGSLARKREEGLFENFFTIPHCQPTDRRCLVGDRLRKITKERKNGKRSVSFK
jgi:hypothetical protein